MTRRLLAALTGVGLFAVVAHAAPREEQWSQVEEAVRQRLPQTAIELLDPIIQAALDEKAFGEATKAIARKIMIEGQIQGGRVEERISRLDARIAQSPPEMVPMIEAIQAHWFWHYYLQNRGRFLGRTLTAEPPGEDFTTWDLPRLFAEIDARFARSLAAEDWLKETPVAMFSDLLVRGTAPDSWRPTLYDFIAHEAITFHGLTEQAAAAPEDNFELAAESPILGSVEEFLLWRPEATDTRSPEFKAIALYQALVRFHRADADQTAFLDANLGRLSYGHEKATGSTKNARYIEQLSGIAEASAQNDISAVAMHRWALVLQEEGRFQEAHDIATKGAQAHANSVGGRLCQGLVRQIESKSLSIVTERVWNRPWPGIRLEYRNLTRVHFRVVSWDWESLLREGPYSGQLTPEERTRLRTMQPVREWSVNVPATPDYKARTEIVPGLALEPGFYFLLSSADPEFGEKDNVVSFSEIRVSDLALVLRPAEGRMEGIVLNANTGEPVRGTQVTAWLRTPTGGFEIAARDLAADENGFFGFAQGVNSREYWIHATAKLGHTMHQITSVRGRFIPRETTLTSRTPVILFTDRALYRPGQTIHYKGIAVLSDQRTDTYEVLSGERVEIVLNDPNGQEVGKAQHVANDFGSFSGSFIAPRDRASGAYGLSVRLRATRSMASFHVEEYKRPKFFVTLDAPKVAAKLNDPVVLHGSAETYTGAPVDGAEVRYRVVREVRWPLWRGWSRFSRIAPPGSAGQEITHATVRTEAGGRFTIEFTARPDPQVPEETEAVFNFSVYADVTDSTGETRSAERRVKAGFTALAAALSADDWQITTAPVELRVRTATLDDEPQAVEGTVRVHRLKSPANVHRAAWWSSDSDPDLSECNNWELGDVVFERSFTTDGTGKVSIQAPLEAGVFRAVLETQDRYGKKVTARLPVRVLDPAAERFGIKVPNLVAAKKWTAEPGEQFSALWGTGYDEGRALVEIEHRSAIIQRYWTRPGRTQEEIRFAVTEAHRGGFTLHVTQVRENRAYLASHRIDVPWSNKDLEVTWEHFTSKIEPDQRETWTAVVKPGSGNAERRVAEMVAALYDASLDAYRPHRWNERFEFFRRDLPRRRPDFQNRPQHLSHLFGRFEPGGGGMLTYWRFPTEIVPPNFWTRSSGLAGGRGGMWFGMDLDGLSGPGETEVTRPGEPNSPAPPPPAGQPAAGDGPDLSQVTARQNLDETAFFFPQLTSDTNGAVRMTFTMPEALTTWRFMGFAHDRQVRSGYFEGTAVTSKDLMVEPNPPRFVREGDVIEFTAKVSNRTAARQFGRVRLTLSDAFSSRNVDDLLANRSPELEFDVPAQESRSYSWRIEVPTGCGFLTYKVVGSTGRLSDGEEGHLPVLSRRVFLTESLPLWMNGAGTKEFRFEKLLASGQSKTLEHHRVTVEMASNPAWYAVMALPYLMAPCFPSADNVFNRLYANALARVIANSDPKVRRVFDQWRATPALDSPLEKSDDLKAIAIEETPWLRQAQSESQARRNVGILFEHNRLENEMAQSLRQLTEMQLSDGSWPWFPGGYRNDYITLYIVSGFGRLRHLGADIDVEPALRAMARLDAWMQERHEKVLDTRQAPEAYIPSPTEALYLYARSFFLKETPVPEERQKAVGFFLTQARKHWMLLGRQSQGHLALALKRFAAFPPLGVANDATPAAIMKSIKERSVSSEEMGLFWRDTEFSHSWYRAPIETQALMIEAFDEVAGDAQAVEHARVWLLKQKQTRDWKTTKATADAVYALLLRGKDILASNHRVEVRLAGKPVLETTPDSGGSGPENRPAVPVEAGTGYYQVQFPAAAISSALAEIRTRKTDAGVAWGAVHWQYFEEISNVTPHSGTPLTIHKAIFTKENTKQGPSLRPVGGPLQVGDELVVRMEIRVDRDLEYVHLKDQRGSGTEPVNVLSRYKYQDGLRYYESTRDTASHFFIDYLPKGAYVFEYSTRLQHRGHYQTGLAEIQCLYAPEFNSRSRSFALVVE